MGHKFFNERIKSVAQKNPDLKPFYVYTNFAL